MQERLSKVVGRTENIVTPVEGDDIFPILHRRLFTTIGSAEHRRRCRRLRRLVRIAERRGARRLPGGQLPGPAHPRLPVPPGTGGHPHQPVGFAVRIPADPGALRTLAHTVKALAQHTRPRSFTLAMSPSPTPESEGKSSGSPARATRRPSTPTSSDPTPKPQRRTAAAEDRSKSSHWPPAWPPPRS